MTHSITKTAANKITTVQTIIRTGLAAFALACALTTTTTASAQSAGSWVDIGNGFAGAGGEATGPISVVKGKSSSKNGVQFGHGFALGAGPNGLAISNTIGAGAGPGGIAHNMNLNIGPGGTHFSHGGVTSTGGNRRVISGGETGIRNGQVYGGSQSTGYGNNTNAWSKSHTRQFNASQFNASQFNSSPFNNSNRNHSNRVIRFNRR